MRLRGLELENRVAMSPMCMYSCPARDGIPTDYHLQHLAARAAGGVGLVLTEATAVEARGRISLQDTGLWHDRQVAPWRRIVEAVHALGAPIGVQLAHAGRKAGTRRPWEGGGAVADDDLHDPEHDATALHPVAPSAVAFGPGMRVPHPLDADGLAAVTAAWVAATRRAADAGFDAVEVHLAHGYLLHQFLTPLANRREGRWGGDLEGRLRYPLEVVAAVRAAWPAERPLLVRISATDWSDGGWDLDGSVELARRLRLAGADLVDVSSGGAVPGARIGPVDRGPEPGYQVPFAARIRREAGIATGAVGLITGAEQAEAIVAAGDADLVLLGRALLRDPYWCHRAAPALGATPRIPPQYQRAW